MSKCQHCEAWHNEWKKAHHMRAMADERSMTRAREALELVSKLKAWRAAAFGSFALGVAAIFLLIVGYCIAGGQYE